MTVLRMTDANGQGIGMIKYVQEKDVFNLARDEVETFKNVSWFFGKALHLLLVDMKHPFYF